MDTPMFHIEDLPENKKPDEALEQRLTFDGTANLDYPDDDGADGTNGLIELLYRYYASMRKPKS